MKPKAREVTPEVARDAEPLQTRMAEIDAGAGEGATAEMVFSTGAPVRRYSWRNDEEYIEVLSLDPKHVRMARIEAGIVPMLDSHRSWDGIDGVIGVIEAGAVDGKRATAAVRFDVDGARGAEAHRKVKARIVRAVSVGYVVHQYTRTPGKSDRELPTYLATDWEPMEVSLVPIPADPTAQMRAQQTRMFPCEIRNAADAVPSKDDAMDEEEKKLKEAQAAAERAAAAQAERDERARQEQIRLRCRAARMTEEFADDLCRRGVPLVEAFGAIVDEVARRDAASGAAAINTRAAVVETVVDEAETRQAAMTEALLHRAAPHRYTLTPAARQYRGMTLVDMARDALQVCGGQTRGMSQREVAVTALNLNPDLRTRAGAMGTSDFPLVLGSTVNRSLRDAFELAPRTFTAWARPAVARDFREMARVAMSELSVFQKVNEAGEYKVLSMSDKREKYALGKYGGVVPITWEAIINDDLDAFGRLPQQLAEEAAATQSDVVYAILSANAAMADGVALFHADHANLAGSGGAISVATLGAARAAMRKQKGPNNARFLNVMPTFLLVGADKETEAAQTLSAVVANAAANVNPEFVRSLQQITEPRITGNVWYLAASNARIDTVEFATLEGEGDVFTETRYGFEVDGVQVKARMPFAAKAIDHRGMYKNPGN